MFKSFVLNKNKKQMVEIIYTLLINIFITVSQLFDILDNDLIRSVIDKEFEKKRSLWISITSIICNVIIFIVSNIMTYYLLTHKKNEIKTFFINEE